MRRSALPFNEAMHTVMYVDALVSAVSARTLPTPAAIWEPCSTRLVCQWKNLHDQCRWLMRGVLSPRTASTCVSVGALLLDGIFLHLCVVSVLCSKPCCCMHAPVWPRPYELQIPLRTPSQGVHLQLHISIGAWSPEHLLWGPRSHSDMLHAMVTLTQSGVCLCFQDSCCF